MAKSNCPVRKVMIREGGLGWKQRNKNKRKGKYNGEHNILFMSFSNHTWWLKQIIMIYTVMFNGFRGYTETTVLKKQG